MRASGKTLSENRTRTRTEENNSSWWETLSDPLPPSPLTGQLVFFRAALASPPLEQLMEREHLDI